MHPITGPDHWAANVISAVSGKDYGRRVVRQEKLGKVWQNNQFSQSELYGEFVGVRAASQEFLVNLPPRKVKRGKDG